uniref:SH3 domain-containing protein n=1 Tax=Anopheles maculatus TaxID=74869 RepID=A0A182SIN2_9DIPT
WSEEDVSCRRYQRIVNVSPERGISCFLIYPNAHLLLTASVLQLLAGQTSLADELSASNRKPHYPPGASGHPGSNFFKQSSLLALKCSYLLDEDSSPDSERLQSLGDVDSGHSTAHSPNDYKSMSPPPPQAASPVTSPFPPPYGGVPYSQLEMLEATHRALHKFIPRHHDEIEIEIGDPIYVQKEAEDLWCEGVNLRTGRQGIFPSAYAVDLDYNDFDPTSIEMKRERYLLGYLGSVETMAHKGTGVVCQAVRKIVGNGTESPKAQPCILEISDQGLRMVDRSRNKKSKGPCIDYFYSLKNVSFCAFHPRDHRYIGFITKHPTVQRFACHVFQGTESTRPVAEAVGRAFQRFYQKFIETAYPIEDIYID